MHQGNGTAVCFASDASVFTFSMHARHNYPLRKESSTQDVELADGADDDQVLAALEDTVEAHVNVWRAARVARGRRPAVTRHTTTARGAHS